MNITLYTISDCAFSKKEKEYLLAKKVVFQEKNLETNREFLTEMLTLSNNFAGTPVTKIEKDDGQIVVLKGFTQEEFDKALETKPVTSQETPPEPVKTPEPSPVSVSQTQPTPAVAETPTPPSAPVIEPTQPVDPALTSILADLQTKAEEPVQAQPSVPAETVPPPQPAPPTPPAPTPPMPTPPLPPIPDFPSQQ